MAVPSIVSTGFVGGNGYGFVSAPELGIVYDPTNSTGPTIKGDVFVTGNANVAGNLAVTGSLTGAGYSGGPISGTTLNLTGTLTGAAANFSAALTAAGVTSSGNVSAANQTLPSCAFEVGTTQCGLNAVSSILYFVAGGSNAGQIDNTGLLTLSNTLSTHGVRYVQGTGATVFGNNINLWWTGSVCQLWVDTTNIGNISTTSDRRIKKNITTWGGNALSLINQVTIRTYNWADVGIFKDDGITHVGVIADEVQAIMPTAVNGVAGALNSDGSIAPQTINVMEVLPILLKGIQELSAQVTALQAQVNSMSTPTSSGTV